jgi:hypothetical protein
MAITRDQAKQHLLTAELTHEAGEMKQFNIRMGSMDLEALRNHFQRKGLKLSSGIRMVLKNYLEEQGLR